MIAGLRVVLPKILITTANRFGTEPNPPFFESIRHVLDKKTGAAREMVGWASYKIEGNGRKQSFEPSPNARASTHPRSRTRPRGRLRGIKPGSIVKAKQETFSSPRPRRSPIESRPSHLGPRPLRLGPTAPPRSPPLSPGRTRNPQAKSNSP